MQTNRRYDIDWIRVIAIGLLLVYHVAIGFQPWGMMIAFITNKESWPSLWIPMSMLNLWRIPLLFFVSGMGAYFALQNRSWKQLLLERSQRILVPFVFGTFCIVPIHWYIMQYHYDMNYRYISDPGHLWFLGNIFIYILIFTPLFVYLKKNELGKAVSHIRQLFSTPLGLLVVVGAFVAEAVLVNPRPFELYAMTRHGFFLGMLAFGFGFCFVLMGERFWAMLQKWRWLFLPAAFGLFILRSYENGAPNYLLSVESCLWVFTVLAFGSRYLNRPSKMLSYLSQAAYPVYVLHMIFLFLSSTLIFPLAISTPLKFILVLLLTLAGSLGCYEIIRRIKYVRGLFGLGWR